MKKIDVYLLESEVPFTPELIEEFEKGTHGAFNLVPPPPDIISKSCGKIRYVINIEKVRKKFNLNHSEATILARYYAQDYDIVIKSGNICLSKDKTLVALVNVQGAYIKLNKELKIIPDEIVVATPENYVILSGEFYASAKDAIKAHSLGRKLVIDKSKWSRI